MKSYTVKPNRTQQTRELFAYIGEAQKIEYDFAPWEEDNGSVSTVAWSTETGQAAITNEALTSSVSSATITTNQEGRSQIKITATAGNNIFVTYLNVLAKDPKTNYYDTMRAHYY